MTRLKKWKILQSHLVLDNPWCQVRQDRVELPNGQIVDDYYITIRPDVALVLPITKEKEIVFVRQYRHGVEQILLELPAGYFNPEQETGEAAAIRELQEETGYTARGAIKLATLYDNPVKDTNRLHAFLAEDVYLTGEQDLDITEDIEVVLIPITEVGSAIAKGDICVSGTVAAIFFGLNFISQREYRSEEK